MTVDMGNLLNDQLGGITNIHQGNVTTVAKAQDYQYLNSLNTIGNALAMREVQSNPDAGYASLIAMLNAVNKGS